MTVVSNQTHDGPFTATGTVTTFPFSFEVSTPSEVKAELDGVELSPALYNVTLNDEGTGSVTFFDAPVGALFLYSDPAFDQPTKLENQGPYLQRTLEAALDREAIKSIYLRGLSARALIAPLGEDGLTIPSSLARRGGFLAFDANGKPYSTSGTGDDGTVRLDLADPTKGSRLIADGEGSLDRVIPPTPLRYGADGGGSIVDTASLLSMMGDIGNYGGDLGRAGYLPAGLYRLDATIPTQLYTSLRGDGPHASVLRNDAGFQIPTIPALTASGALTFANFEDIGARGQKSFIDVTGPTDHNLFRNIVATGMADAGFRFRDFLQTSVFDRIMVESSPYGIIAESIVVNRNTWREPEFKGCTESAIKLEGSEDNKFLGARFEASTQYPGKYAIDIANVASLTFDGGYMEQGHQFALRSQLGKGIITFRDFHFTFYQGGAGSDPFVDAVPYLWDVDPGTILIFENCHSSVPMEVPSTAILLGQNINIFKTQATVASASVITLPRGQKQVTVTGTTTIDAITGGTQYIGQETTLEFTAAATLRDVSTGGNCKLAGSANFVAAADSVITLYFNGANWIEKSRSVN